MCERKQVPGNYLAYNTSILHWTHQTFMFCNEVAIITHLNLHFLRYVDSSHWRAQEAGAKHCGQITQRHFILFLSLCNTEEAKEREGYVHEREREKEKKTEKHIFLIYIHQWQK